jgi:two-component system phosphate regulon sensor histidine kinase PhoR
VETILKASQLEKQEIKLNKAEIHLHAIIEQVVDNFSLQLQNQDGSASLELNANSDLVIADEVHLTNLVSNLVDNALKYSRENVPSAIKISTSLTGKSIMLRIEDNGIGMTKDALKRIFEKFYRAHTGNRHDVKGFGLGLSYVKTVVEAHHGKIKAESVLGKGSTFTIELPLAS